MLTLEEVLEKHPMPFRPDPKTGKIQKLNALQIEDINSLARYERALADLPVGYGKTAIATCVALMKEPDVSVIIMPPILVPRWVEWLRAIPGAGRAVAYEGTPAKRKAINLTGAQWLAMSYGIFKNDLKYLMETVAECRTFLIEDEAQNSKSPSSKLFQAVRDFSAGQELLMMSGTIMSKPGDAYSYIKLKTPSIYQSLKHFENVHVVERDFFGQVTEWGNLDLLQSNLRLNCVYRTKEEVHAHLPKANYFPVKYDLSPEHMKLYKRLMDEQLLELDEGKIDATTATALYHAAQQIIVNYGYYANDPALRSASFDLIDEVCDEIGVDDPANSKLIIWTVYKRTSAAVLEYLKDRGAVAAYSGADSKKSLYLFENDPKTRIIVAQPGSMGAGTNPQYVSSESLFIETLTTTIPVKQAAGRQDREGQRFRSNIRFAVAQGTIQEMLHANLLSNDKLVQRASGSKKSLKDFIYPS
jgi:superfamily II DNA or RNA helicase